MRQSIPMETARRRCYERANNMNRKQVISIYEAAGRVVSMDYDAKMDQPPFDRSPLDGFAQRAEDFCNATKDNPVTLEIDAQVYAGDFYQGILPKTKAVRIMTGAPIPEGADCVVRIEDVECTESSVTFFDSMKKGDNICLKGEDIRSGLRILSKGEVLTAAHAGVLASQGYYFLDVYDEVKVLVLSTGSELVEGNQLEPGKIFNSNGPMISMRLKELGFETKCRCCEDNIEVIVENIQKYCNDVDCIITTGGVSVGDKDYLPEVIERLGAETLFHGVAMKPGTPMLAADYMGKMIFALSGNPFAALATLEVVALPAMLKMQGRTKCFPFISYLPLENAFLKSSKKGRRFIRATRRDGKIYLPDNHSSGSLASSIGCNCMVDIKAGSKEMQTGDIVRVVNYLTYTDAVSEEEAQKDDEMKEIPVVCITGTKNVGKTTMMEYLIGELSQMGVGVGAIKHDGHDFIPDVEGTDSERFRKAGSYGVLVYSKERVLSYEEKKEANLTQAVLAMSKMLVNQESEKKIILVEGCKDSDFDKIELVRGEVCAEEYLEAYGQKCYHNVSKNGNLIALCTDVSVKVLEYDEEKVMRISLSDRKNVLDLICERYQLL